MRIGYRLVLGYVLIAALSGVTMYLANRSYHQIDRIFEDLSSDTVPEIEALESLKLEALRIIASTSEYALIEEEEADKGEDRVSRQASTEREQISSSIENYDKAFAKYDAFVDQNAAWERDSRREIQLCGADLIRLSAELINIKRKGLSGEEAIEKKEEFENAETKFLAAVDQAMTALHAQLYKEDGTMHATISTSKSLTLIVYFFTLSLSLTIGLYISRSISRPVNQLRDASREIGKGKLDTQINIRSNDEIGELAAAFNKMTADLRQSHIEILAAKNFVDNIIGSMTDLLIVTNMDGDITRVNSAVNALLGYEDEALLGASLRTVLAKRTREVINNAHDLRAIESAGSAELTCRRADGSMRRAGYQQIEGSRKANSQLAQ